jgi:hypothetical protein
MHHEYNVRQQQESAPVRKTDGKGVRLLAVCVLSIVVVATCVALTPASPAHADSTCGWLLPCLTPVASPRPTVTPAPVITPTPAPKPTAPTRPVVSPTPVVHFSPPTPTTQPALVPVAPFHATPSPATTRQSHQPKGKTPTTKKSVTVQGTQTHTRQDQPARPRTMVALLPVLIIGVSIALFLAVVIALLTWRRRYLASRPRAPIISWEPTPAPVPNNPPSVRGWTDTVKAPVIGGAASVRPPVQATTMFPDFRALENVSSLATDGAADSPQSDTLIGLPRQRSPWHNISDEPFIT